MSTNNSKRGDIIRRFLFIQGMLVLWAILKVVIPLITRWDQIDLHFGLILALRLSGYFTVSYAVEFWKEKSLSSWLWRG